MAHLRTTILPAGIIRTFADDVAPDGWLICDGSALTTSTFFTLFQVIGTAYGTPNFGLFNIPDFRGKFLRGLDSGASNDPDAILRIVSNVGGNTGDNIGSSQGTATKKPIANFATTTESQSHTHDTPPFNNTSGWSNGIVVNNTGVFNNQTSGKNSSRSKSNSANHTHTINSGGDNESRPLNVYVQYIIKY